MHIKPNTRPIPLPRNGSEGIFFFRLIATSILIILMSGLVANPDKRNQFKVALANPSGTCPPFEITSKFTIAYGDVILNSVPASEGMIVTAKSPRGDVVGCFNITTSGIYGAMYVYGEDTSVTPTLPGMRTGEQVSFFVEGVSALSTPNLLWQNDKDLHEVDLNATGQPAPTADFSATPTSGLVPLPVQFTDLSQGNITGRVWTFGDGGLSTLQNPSHTYQQAGVFTVSLTISGPGGTDTKTRTDYITVQSSTPVADFSASPLSGVAPLPVNFTNLSTNYSLSVWSFGDGGTSSLTNPSHTYTQKGVYSVTLAVLGPGGSDDETKTDYIQVYAPVVADFTQDTTTGSAPLTVHFTNLTTGDFSLANWNFGDGSTSQELHPTHVFQSPGTFTVTLNMSGPGGSDQEIKVDLITATPPQISIFLPIVCRQ